MKSIALVLTIFVCTANSYASTKLQKACERIGQSRSANSKPVFSATHQEHPEGCDFPSRGLVDAVSLEELNQLNTACLADGFGSIRVAGQDDSTLTQCTPN